MEARLLKIVFMGSGNFAAQIIEGISQDGYNICTIYTAPQPTTKSRNINLNKVQLYAENHKITLRQPHSFTEEEIALLSNLKPDIILVAAYGLILPQAVLDIAPHPINVHPSLLPRWRGAAPLERAIEAGDTQTAVTIMKMNANIDEGEIVVQRIIPLDEAITADQLAVKTADIAIEQLKYIIDDLQITNRLNLTPQQKEGKTYAKKISKDELLLDFNNDVKMIHNRIRAFDRAGGCYFIYKEKRIKILQATYSLYNEDEKSINQDKTGTLDKKNCRIHCENGYILPLLLQREGGRITRAKEFFNGI